MAGLVTLLSAEKKGILGCEYGRRGRFFYFSVHLKFFHTNSAQKFSINVWQKIFRHGPVDRYATFKQGPEGRLKFSGQGPANFFQSGSARNFSIRIRLQIFRQGLMHFSRTPACRRGTCGFMFQSRSGYFFSGRVCSKVFNQSVVGNFPVRSG